jgi:hypothetical protein
MFELDGLWTVSECFKLPTHFLPSVFSGWRQRKMEKLVGSEE